MVYLVDDDADDLELLQEIFEKSGFKGQVACAKNGQDFMSKLRQSNLPELIVLDLNMPLKNGFEVLIDLKKSKHFSVVPVVILTASHNTQDEKKCVDLGCDLFLRKPSTLKGYDAIVLAMIDLLRDYRGSNSPIIGTPEESP